MNHGLTRVLSSSCECVPMRVCVPSRLRRAKQLQQSAVMLRGAANHRQPILPQLLHSMRQEISDDMGGRQSCCQHSALSTQQHSSGSPNFQACLPARASDPSDGYSRLHRRLSCWHPTSRCHPTDSSSTRSRSTSKTAHYVPSHGALAVKITNLIRTSSTALPNSSFPGPTGRALRRIRATSPLALPCEPA